MENIEVMPFLFFDLNETWAKKAEAIRKKRDEQYGNIYEEAQTDVRWVGDLGETCFNAWIKTKGEKDFVYHLDNAAADPNFVG